jgi:gamma-glutamyltranspeptidase/glutathione hydrolase
MRPYAASLLIPAILLTTLPLDARDPVRAAYGMVVAEEPLAADVGVAVLKSGGNAVDAAVAVGFALAVTHPFAGNLGGGGFMLIRLADGKSTFIDFRERAPGKASHDMYLGPDGKPTRESIEGWRSSGVPGSVRGFEMANAKYGTRKWADLVSPAVELAAKGFPLSYRAADGLANSRALAADPESKRIFTGHAAGDPLMQPELAATLRRIAANGAKEFYEGETAKRFAAEMEKHGGLITLADLKNYQATERAPLSGMYRNYTILTAPPPSSGGAGLLQMLGMLDGTGYEKSGFGSASAIHYVAEVMRRFFADRGAYFGDPDFVKVPLTGLLDRSYIQQRRGSIDTEHVTPSDRMDPGKPAGSELLAYASTVPANERLETTHYSIVDAQGNAVAVTYTLNGGYGNGITVPGLGFLLNNEMDDFAAKPGSPNLFGLVQGEANAVQPGKRPSSSMTPTIVLRDGKLYMVLGAPGGPRITTAVFQTVINVLDFGMNIQDAVDAPRIHHQWKPDVLMLERGVSPDTVAILQAKGHKVDYSPGVVLARVEAILVDPEWTPGQKPAGSGKAGWLQGAADGRWVGKAAGY